MPISRENINALRPQKVILGYIHKPMTFEGVCYCGSSCGLDITETGKRSFLLFDTVDGSTIEREVPGTPLYFNETFILVPSENEVEHCCAQIRERIAAWGIVEQDMARTVVKVSVKGNCMDKSAILNSIKEEFAHISHALFEFITIGIFNLQLLLLVTQAVNLIASLIIIRIGSSQFQKLRLQLLQPLIDIR
jgi:hypothetical protein